MPLLRPSANVSWSELACNDSKRTPYPEAWRESRAVRLCAEFERIRAIIAKPIKIGSAYRTPEWNAKVGGARNSQHMQGRALDLYPPSGWTLERFYEVIRAVALDSRSGIYGLGKYPSFVHIDIRPVPSHGRLISWTGNRTTAELKVNRTA